MPNCPSVVEGLECENLAVGRAGWMRPDGHSQWSCSHVSREGECVGDRTGCFLGLPLWPLFPQGVLDPRTSCLFSSATPWSGHWASPLFLRGQLVIVSRAWWEAGGSQQVVPTDGSGQLRAQSCAGSPHPPLHPLLLRHGNVGLCQMGPGSPPPTEALRTRSVTQFLLLTRNLGLGRGVAQT